MKPFDALIAGAGPAGSTAAILLARAGWKAAIVEKPVFPRRKVCGEYISGAAWPLLAELGVAARVAALAGPEVRRVGLFAGDVVLAAPMPNARAAGRALGRDHLDTVLLEQAIEHGAEAFQPSVVARIERSARGFECAIETKGETRAILARTVIGAHGAWEPGTLPTQGARRSARAADLLGFKARFRGARLPQDLMPLVLFSGGYGGLVHSDAACVSFSCCVRRDALARARRPGERAADALLASVLASNRGMREALDGATPESSWLSAGPIRPAIRRFERDGVFAIGNAAGEAHPIVAEGISMAIQSAFLLCERLLERGADSTQAIAREYEAQWRGNFAARVHAAALFARVLMNPVAGRAAVGILERLPAVLTAGAHWGGKDRALRRPPLSGDRR